MISPDIKDLMRNMDSRYTLVVATAKRARQITDGAEPLTKFRSDKPVTLAVHEIAEGKVEYFRDASRQTGYETDRSLADAPRRGFQLYGGIAGEFDDEEAHGAEAGFHDLSEAYHDYSEHDDIPAADDAREDDFERPDDDSHDDEHEDAGWIE